MVLLITNNHAYSPCFRRNGLPWQTKEFVHGWSHHVLHENLDGTVGRHRGGVRSRRQKSSGEHLFVSVRLVNKWHRSPEFLAVADPGSPVGEHANPFRGGRGPSLINLPKFKTRHVRTWSTGGRILRANPLDPPMPGIAS